MKIRKVLIVLGWGLIAMAPFSTTVVIYHHYWGPAPALLLVPAVSVILTFLVSLIGFCLVNGVAKVIHGVERLSDFEYAEADAAVPLVVKVGTYVAGLLVGVFAVLPFLPM